MGFGMPGGGGGFGNTAMRMFGAQRPPADPRFDKNGWNTGVTPDSPHFDANGWNTGMTQAQAMKQQRPQMPQGGSPFLQMMMRNRGGGGQGAAMRNAMGLGMGSYMPGGGLPFRMFGGGMGRGGFGGMGGFGGLF